MPPSSIVKLIVVTSPSLRLGSDNNLMLQDYMLRLNEVHELTFDGWSLEVPLTY